MLRAVASRVSAWDVVPDISSSALRYPEEEQAGPAPVGVMREREREREAMLVSVSGRQGGQRRQDERREGFTDRGAWSNRLEAWPNRPEAWSGVQK